jgi:ceramide glucosyltransferase
VAACLALSWWLLGMVVHWGSALIALRDRAQRPPRHQAADFSIVAPLAGSDDASADYVDALAALSRAGAEVLVCVATPDDGAIAPLKARWPEAPLLVGSSDTFNPKMNNVRKGLEAAKREVVVLCDAGIALELEDLRIAAAALSDEVGLVLALKAATDPANFAAEMERAYLNGHQARFLLLADRIGMAVASGGVTLLTNKTLQRIGNWQGFNRWIADDYSVVRSVRELGMATTLGNRLLKLPLGRRDWSMVWRRQVRWARTRLRLPVWPVVALEPLIGAAVTGLAGALGLAALGVGTGMICLFVGVHLLAWMLAEKVFVEGRGLEFVGRAIVATLVREALAPVLMVQALAGRTIDWRGADLGGRWRDTGADAARRLGNGG